MVSHQEHEDIDFEPEDELGSVGAAKAKLQKLKDELEQVKKERQEYLDGWQRAKADFVNGRQETLRQAQQASSRALLTLVDDLIPAIDGFDMAAGSPSWESVSPEWRSGVAQIQNQILDALSRNGIERYGKNGDAFDHNLHEAVQETDDMPGNPGEVVRVLRHGYKKDGKVIRPAQVIVKK